jgi:NAD(P)-dependent dehydrogenase (short-subunit alcohol dehydrogenase family)
VTVTVLLIGEDEALEAELGAQGLELVRDAVDAEALITLAPRPELRAIAELEPGEWRRLFAAWVEEPFFAAQPWLRRAQEQGGGSWIAITSVLGTQPFPGGIAGAAALTLQTLVRVAALEGIRANVVASGWRDDRLPEDLDRELAVADTPGGRLATAADVAAVAAWLLSPDAGHVSGQVIDLDGGYTITRGSRPDPRKE